MIRVIALILLVAVVWKGIPFVFRRLLRSGTGEDIVRPLDDQDHQDV
jgi:hypothetical protein